MDNAKLHFLTEVSDILTKIQDISELRDNMLGVLKGYCDVLDLNLYVYDCVSDNFRNCAESWGIIDENQEIYNAFSDITGHDFVINSKAYKLPAVIGDITIKPESIYMPIVRGDRVFGLISLQFAENTSVNMDFLFLMKIFASQVSLKLQNIILDEQSRVNVEFHDSMKNIAKIIETQYELNYIVPLIGEMLDRFISDHLIYVFLKHDGEFQLVWPKACNDERVYEAARELTTETEYVLLNDNKIGAFPLVSEGEISGCIVARSTLDALSKRDISYLEQLTRQSSITINRANAYSKILQYATIDALTNLNNRRQFEIRLGQEIASAKRQHNPLCAMMIDIDFFKKVNDTYGHASGDAVLRGVASIVKDTLRESDIPSRYGGEEFAILLPYTHIDEARIVGERLRKAVESAAIAIDSENIDTKSIKVTISMGITEFNFEETGEELFERADKALYEAKTSGRNKVCVI